jgi:phosphatidylinositol alpha-1,6-mannosyltransferase
LDRCPAAQLTVAGDGSDRRRLERIASLLGVAERVRFLGHVSDVELRQAYARAALFALPARCRLGKVPEGEGFGLVLAEAGRAGLPVVAGRAGPAAEVVLDGDTGILVEPEDIEEIANAICQLLENPERARWLGARAEQRVTNEFSYEKFRRGIQGLVDFMLTAV